MSTFLKIAFVLLFISKEAYSQEKNNIVRDTILEKKLRKYLIEHIDFYTIDSAGKRKLDSFMQKEYKDVSITSGNLKTDSILLDKNLLGIYSYRFADISSHPHLYIQYSNKIEFIELDSKNFRLNKLLKKIMKFFKKYSNQFTLQEKVKTIQGVMETIYNNKFEEYSW
jgi:hypothetical protein